MIGVHGKISLKILIKMVEAAQCKTRSNSDMWAQLARGELSNRSEAEGEMHCTSSRTRYEVLVSASHGHIHIPA